MEQNPRAPGGRAPKRVVGAIGSGLRLALVVLLLLLAVAVILQALDLRAAVAAVLLALFSVPLALLRKKVIQAREGDCAKCGTGVKEHDRFCRGCGVEITRTRRTIAAGRICILDGLLMAGMLALFVYIAATTHTWSVFDIASFAVAMILIVVLGTLAVVGAIFALMRRRWGWALAGAIAAVFPFVPLGIISLILLATSKGEFDQLRPHRLAK